MGRKKHDGVALAQRLDAPKLRPVVLEGGVVTLGVEHVDQPGGDIDHEGAVGGRNLLEIASGLALYLVWGLVEFARDARQAAAKAGTSQDVFVDQPRNLVAFTAKPALGAFQGQRSLSGDELVETRRFLHVLSARDLPPHPQLRSGRWLASDDATAVPLATEDPMLAQRPRIARIAKADDVREAYRPDPVAFAWQPDHSQGRQQYVDSTGETLLQGSQRNARSPSPRGIDGHPLVFRPVGTVAQDPALGDPALGGARSVEEKDDSAPVALGPFGLVAQGRPECGSGRHYIPFYHSGCQLCCIAVAASFPAQVVESEARHGEYADGEGRLIDKEARRMVRGRVFGLHVYGSDAQPHVQSGHFLLVE